MSNYSDEYLNKYILDNDLPKISILDFWPAYNRGKYTFYLETYDKYPTDKIEIISNINDMTGDYVISANKRDSSTFLIINYLKKINGENSYLFTKDEYISKYLNPGKIAICIKNFERNESSNLVAISVKHFIPDAKIYLFNFYDERKNINVDYLDQNLYQDIVNIPTKYLLGQILTNCSNARNNGLYYTEGFNLMYKYFQDYNGKLLMLDDNHFFTNGNTLKEILDNDFDIAWAFFGGTPPKLNGDYLIIPHKSMGNICCGGYINASILCINPIKFKNLNVFPLPEYREYIETILTEKLIDNNNLVKYQIKSRYDGDYSNDGIYSNNAEEMKQMMMEYNILDKFGNQIKNILSTNNEKIAIIIQGPSLYVNEIKNAWYGFDNNIIFSTWKGDENKYNENDIVIFNDIPTISGPKNFNYQKISTYNGLLKAKELGYTHVLKIRSDYLPTNANEFIKLLDFNKLNFLMWDYTTYLWTKYPTFNGYFDDHFSFGKVDDMITLWDIPFNFCDSPETMLTWNYINKLKDVDVNYILPHLNENNDLYYIKFDNNDLNNCYAHNIINKNFGDRELIGRYESVFNNNSEYKKTPNETRKFMNDDYLNFLKFYNNLPKISINLNSDIKKNIIYPEHKLEFISNIDDATGEYIINSCDILSNTTLILEYFKKKNIIYINPTTSLVENNIYESNLLTLEEYKKKKYKYK
jgi:hypothetical protein